MFTSETREQHVLSCKNLSLFSTINGINSWSRILSPPPIAQFIKEVNLKAFSGEVHGITGSPGSGKSTLVEAISCQGNGDVTGSLQLNHNLLTRERFSNLGSFVHPKHYILPMLTVRSLLYYTGSLYLGGLTTITDIHKRVSRVMVEFEILQYSQKKISELSKNATRRLLVALAVIKDPHDILYGLDSFSSYHMLTCLSNFAKKNNRIVLLSLRTPRSDLYQLLDRVTILFYGETFYSGRTKDLPGYFRDLGYPCPATENPAMYFLTLSTIDRETPDRFAETQEQAIFLVTKFKNFNQSSNDDFHGNRELYDIGSTTALCYLERPSLTRRFVIILRRNIEIFCSSPTSLISLLLLAPIFSLVVSMFTSDFSSGGRSAPHSVNGFFSSFVYLISAIVIFNTSFLYSSIILTSYKEYWDGVSNQVLPLLSFLLLSLPILLLISFSSSIVVLWRVHLFSWINAVVFASLLLMIGLMSQAITLCLMIFIQDDVSSLSYSLSTLTIFFSLSGMYMRSIASLTDSWWIVIITTNPFVYVGHLTSSTLVSPLKVSNCTQTTRLDVDSSPVHTFCRWKSGLEAHQEKYPDGYEVDSSIVYLLLFLSVFYLILFLVHFIRKPAFLIKKFL